MRRRRMSRAGIEAIRKGVQRRVARQRTEKNGQELPAPIKDALAAAVNGAIERRTKAIMDYIRAQS